MTHMLSLLILSIDLLIDIAWVFTAENIGVDGGVGVQKELMSHQIKAEWFKSLQQNSCFLLYYFTVPLAHCQRVLCMFLTDLVIHNSIWEDTYLSRNFLAEHAPLGSSQECSSFS